MGHSDPKRHTTRFLLLCLLLLLRQHSEGELEGVCGGHLVRDVLGGLLDCVKERLVHGGGLDLILELGIGLLQVRLQGRHAVKSLHQILGRSHLLLFE